MEITLNLWDADVLGDGTTTGKQLTAYILKDGQTETQNHVSVPVSDEDYEAFTDGEDVWYGDGDTEFVPLLQLFILNQLLVKENN
jgi:hypothetical protein